MGVIATVLGWLFSEATSATSALVALAQVNTGFFGASIALLTIVPSLIELVKDKSANFVDQAQQIDQLDESIKLFRYSTAILGVGALCSTAMTIYPTPAGIIISFAVTIAGSLLLSLGGYRLANITYGSLVDEW